ncbi:hypothetical protein cyc_02623 [Cyclospora cayetanensis]|uniref:Uncharacterized protein n=1 Tax=Cyclospora cayetanensis TaxID=88456 RepID=A0A1D3D7R0_9EIME|nr:hypothetical protein cyc_02623 [Cyclospora cayetanensis]
MRARELFLLLVVWCLSEGCCGWKTSSPLVRASLVVQQHHINTTEVQQRRGASKERQGYLKSLQQPYRNRQPQSMVQQEPQGKQEQKMQREELLLLPQLVTGKQYRYTVSLLPQTHPLLRNSSWQVLQDVRIHEMLRRVARMPATVAVSGEALASDPAGVLDAATGEKQRPLEVLQHRFCMGCMRSAAALAEGSHDFSRSKSKVLFLRGEQERQPQDRLTAVTGGGP